MNKLKQPTRKAWKVVGDKVFNTKKEYYEFLAKNDFRESLDNTPVAVPLEMQQAETADQKLRRMLNYMILKNQIENEEETPEESVDFSIRDVPLRTGYNEFITKADIRKARKYEQEQYAKKQKTGDGVPVGRKSAETDPDDESGGKPGKQSESRDSARKTDSGK